MKKVRTATFALGRYRVVEYDRILGSCDVPGDNDLELAIMPGSSQQALAVLLEEMMHAEGIPDKYLHSEDKNDQRPADRMARCAWRLGWRRRT